MSEDSRIRDIVLLAQGWLDYYPAARGGSAECKSRSGKAKSYKGPCGNPHCDGGLERGTGRPCVDCGGCYRLNGHGGLEAVAGKGWLWFDAYTDEPVGSDETPVVPRLRSLVCDGCGGDGAHGNGHRCEHCSGTGRVVVSVTEEEPEERTIVDPLLDALTRHRKRRDELGVYRDLADGLLRLKALDRLAAQVFSWVFILGAQAPGTLNDSARMALLRAVVFLDREMPAGRIRVPREIRAREEARQLQLRRVKGNEAPRQLLDRRNAEILRRHGRGASVEALMGEFSLSRRMVMYVLAEGATRRAA